jgi:hypothetical protein
MADQLNLPPPAAASPKPNLRPPPRPVSASNPPPASDLTVQSSAATANVAGAGNGDKAVTKPGDGKGVTAAGKGKGQGKGATRGSSLSNCIQGCVSKGFSPLCVSSKSTPSLPNFIVPNHCSVACIEANPPNQGYARLKIKGAKLSKQDKKYCERNAQAIYVDQSMMPTKCTSC